MFFKIKTIFQNLVPKYNFFYFLKTQKTILKNYFQKLFSTTVLKNNNQTYPKLFAE